MTRLFVVATAARSTNHRARRMKIHQPTHYYYYYFDHWTTKKFAHYDTTTTTTSIVRSLSTSLNIQDWIPRERTKKKKKKSSTTMTLTIQDWIRRERTKKKSSTTITLPKKKIGTKQQISNLERLVEQSVKDYLLRTYPKAFSTTTPLILRPKKEKVESTTSSFITTTTAAAAATTGRMQSLANFQLRLRQQQHSSSQNKNDNDDNNDNTSQNNNNNNKNKLKKEEPIISDQLQTLLDLNGYNRVATPSADDSVRLAEGVVARPSFYSNGGGGSSLMSYYGRQPRQPHFILYSQTMDDHYLNYSQPPKNKKQKKKLPKMIAEDIKIYRKLEKQVDQMLQVQYNAFKYRYNAFQKKYQEMEEWIHTNIIRKIIPTTTTMTTNGPLSSNKENNEKKKEASSIILSKNVNSLENLLIVGDDSHDDNDDDDDDNTTAPTPNLLLISFMEPSRRLLALPHGLKLNTASTLISVSFVVFGALPLAYRSIHFAMEYESTIPILATPAVMSLSVAGTVAYGIWSSRDASRTRQAEQVARALQSRIYAKDEAVVWVLQQGAIRRISHAVVQLYYHHHPDTTTSCNNNNNTFTAIDVADEKKNELVLSDLPQKSVHLLDIAMDLGLIEKNATPNGYRCTSTDIANICAILESKS